MLNVADVVTNVYASTDPAFSMGMLITDTKGNEYRFVQNGLTAATLTAHYPAVFMAVATLTDPTDHWKVVPEGGTGGYSDAFVGVAVANMASYEYGWVQAKGVHSSARVSGTVTDGNAIVLTTNGCFAPAATAEVDPVVGFVLDGADAGTVTDALVYVDGF